MKTNIDIIQDVVDYIEYHLEENLCLDNIATHFNYSKYHLSRMFMIVIGFTIHRYIQRRRLTEAANLLVNTDKSMIDIALSSGYETQQSFHLAFKSVYKCNPQAYRKRQDFYPLQLPYKVDGQHKLRGNKIMDIRIVKSDSITIVGYQKNTRFGFFVIGRCWHQLHNNKQSIPSRKNMYFLIGLNDYKTFNLDSERQPTFDYIAGAEVHRIETLPKGMCIKELPESTYVVFSYRANCEDSLQSVVDYIYNEWFPQSTCILNDKALYDFAKYGEVKDIDGKSLIEYWVPIL